MTRSIMRLNMMLCLAIALAHGRDAEAQRPRRDSTEPSARQNQSGAQAQTPETFAASEGLGWELSATADGVLVERILNGSPAAEAGIEERDLIIKVGNESVLTPGRTVELLQEHQPQSRVQVTVLREEEELSYLFPLDDIPPEAFAASSSGTGASDQNLVRMIERLQQQCEQQEQLLITLLDEVQSLRARLDGAVAPTTTGGSFHTTPTRTGSTYTGDIVAPLSGGGQTQPPPADTQTPDGTQPPAGTQPRGTSAPPRGR